MLIREMYSVAAFETITVNSTVQTLDATKVAPTSGGQIIGVLITIDGADIRMTFDGTAPVGGGAGHYFSDGTSIEVWETNNIARLKMIRNGSTNASANVSYYKA